MPPAFISRANLDFLLYDVFDVGSLTQHPYFADHGRETFDLALDTAMKAGREMLQPAFEEMDRQAPEYVDGTVNVHPLALEIMKWAGEGGWIGAHASYEEGGQQMPGTVMAAFRTILAAANYSAAVYPFLTSGAAHLIGEFGSRELIDTYVEKMYAGCWQGTMALTEPQAGSSLTDLATTAVPTEDVFYKLKGQKIFISCGEYEGIENIVHLLLARIEGAPAGVKGISLFVVPKLRPENGALVPNDIVCTEIYHKLGYRGAPITRLSLGDEGDCRGWLVGEPNRGLACMFQMMNEARIDVGMSAAAIASAAYCASLEYARERPQGRKIGEKDPATPQVPLIEHADVKRMLLFQRAIVEGSLALNLQCALYADRTRVLEGEEKTRAQLLLDLLTPIAKSYPSEMGILSVSAGLQILGGYGYCEDYPLEQHYRDVRIHTIHEGTTAIQGMDLLGRKVVMQNGKTAMLFFEEVGQTIERAKKQEALAGRAAELADALGRLQQTTMKLTALAMEGKIELFLADATLYLETFGVVTLAWQWLQQAVAIGDRSDAFALGKLQTFQYFFDYELPKVEGLAVTLQRTGGTTVGMKGEWFG